MSDALIDKLSDVSLATVVVIVILLSTSLNSIIPFLKKIKDAIISRYKKDKKEDSIQQLVLAHEAKLKEFQENRIQDRAQSLEIQRELVQSIKDLNKRLDDLEKLQTTRYNESLERENKRVRAELKDRIRQLYKHHHETQEWDYTEMEVMVDLINEYEAAGGTNSFVHDLVLKEMHHWRLHDIEPNLDE